MPSGPENRDRPVCPSCGAPVEPGAPACPACGEQLYVEHPGQYPRDATAVEEMEQREKDRQ
ncbi:zinc ribbon domain-containing protein [Posidoniimonas polymericola]|uniref:zinc ribbon domain-containing protein n=1 Tax=Posidoniimonas polymericola TaxID=2528002 RepID=UPI0011B58F86